MTMFKKVLVSDDLDCINQGIISVLNTLNIEYITQVAYCDDAFLKIEKAILDNAPFDLLITDLSFIADHRKQKYPSGEVLIRTLKQKHPQLKIIAYSVEDKLQKVRTVMLESKADAYVCKGRHGLEQITEAIQEVYKGNQYLSPQIQNALNKKLSVEISDYDIEILKLLSHGLSQKEISEDFLKNNITPSSLSSVEKKISKLCDHFKANNTTHLVAIVKDLALI
ncbi:response regulator containing a CheY-like receiver domain and an HTH DNA-binding domain [Aequorivita sublithincola DSM 14238]|uniref:Response regulator containing a CheY-like receiver domain and an HTH DNA-binding domain n=2 Tax=Aequorivita TaxID=153265 RepID=I3YRU0_AEQSU|nr:response regulator containing a CheY-like receiver domain and an HTH DNA-binding domain [Aequorivita sublithincola DSM 14238]